jgi:imidazolonepropionase-like amidohydrolase
MFRIVAMGTCVLGLIASPAAVAGQADVVLLGAKIITADPKQPTTAAIALAGERILRVGANDEIRRLAGPNTQVVDLRGRTVIPGLMDAHVHLFGPELTDEPSLRNYERAVLSQVMTGLISRGITTIRSTGDPLPYVVQLRDRLERRDLVGPRLLITGPALGAPNGHPAASVFRTNPFLRRLAAGGLESERHARQVVQQVTSAKVDAVKVVVDDIVVNVPPLSDAVLAAVIDQAHRAGVRCIVHLSVMKNGIFAAKRLIDMGVDEFVHTPIAQAADVSSSADVSGLAASLTRRRLPVTTTLSIAEVFRDANGGERAMTGGPYTPATRDRLERRVNNIRKFSEAGVKLVVGTDWAPAYSSLGDPRLLPGATTLHEMELLRRAGLSTPAILTAATRNGMGTCCKTFPRCTER